MEYQKLEGIALNVINNFKFAGEVKKEDKFKVEEDKFPLVEGNNLTTVFVKFMYCKEDHKIDMSIIPNDEIKAFIVSLIKAFPIVCASILKAKPELSMDINDFTFNCIEHITIEYKGRTLHVAPHIKIKKEKITRAKSDMDWLN